MTGIVKTGALTGTTLVVAIGSQPTPINITLTSTAPGRGIRLSSAGGIAGSWYSPDLDADTTAAITLAVLAPVTHVEFTGAPGDTYRVH